MRLTDYSHVLWLLGDESTSDPHIRRNGAIAPRSVCRRGWRPSSIGLRARFCHLVHLHVPDPALHLCARRRRYQSRPADTRLASPISRIILTFLTGDTEIWAYDNGGSAAVGYNQQVICVGFPLENSRSPRHGTCAGRPDQLASLRAQP